MPLFGLVYVNRTKSIVLKWNNTVFSKATKKTSTTCFWFERLVGNHVDSSYSEINHSLFTVHSSVCQNHSQVATTIHLSGHWLLQDTTFFSFGCMDPVLFSRNCVD